MSEPSNESPPTGSDIVDLAELRAVEVCEHARLEEKAAALLEEDMSAEAFLSTLEQHGEHFAAIQVLAQALDPRRTVRWAVDCCRAHAPADVPEEEQDILDAVDEWLAAPSDEDRRTIGAAAEEVGLERPSACVALSVFFAEGSLAPADLDEVPVPEGACGQAASGAILLVLVQDRPEAALEKASACLARGREVALEEMPIVPEAPEADA